MGFWHKGKWRYVPWNEDFEQKLIRISERTYDYKGDELLHAIHKEVMESNQIKLHLHSALRRLLWVIISFQCAIILLLL